MGIMEAHKHLTIPEHLLERRRAGKVTLREMALACGVCVATIWRELRRLGFPSPAQARHEQSLARRRQVAALRAGGLSVREIGQRLGISYQAAAQLLKPLKGKKLTRLP